MPYIKAKQRQIIDQKIYDLALAMKEASVSEGGTINNCDAGVLNYTITRLILLTNGDLRYHNLNAAVGALECCKMELYRRLVAEYEDTKITENGDVGYKLGDIEDILALTKYGQHRTKPIIKPTLAPGKLVKESDCPDKKEPTPPSGSLKPW